MSKVSPSPQFFRIGVATALAGGIALTSLIATQEAARAAISRTPAARPPTVAPESFGLATRVARHELPRLQQQWHAEHFRPATEGLVQVANAARERGVAFFNATQSLGDDEDLVVREFKVVHVPPGASRHVRSGLFVSDPNDTQSFGQMDESTGAFGEGGLSTRLEGIHFRAGTRADIDGSTAVVDRRQFQARPRSGAAAGRRTVPDNIEFSDSDSE